MAQILAHDQIKINSSDPENAKNVARRMEAPLRRLLEVSPSDSSMIVTVDQPNNYYMASVVIRSSDGEFKGFGEDLSLSAALDEAIQQIYYKLRSWRKIRFQDLPKSDLKALVIDDDPAASDLMSRCLAENCRVQTANTGDDAVHMLSPFDVDVLVLDWMMPGMDGRKTLEQMDLLIKKTFDPDWMPRRKIPVIVYSSKGQNEIDFPVTKNFFKLGHLKKSLSYPTLNKLAKQYVRTLREAPVHTQ